MLISVVGIQTSRQIVCKALSSCMNLVHGREPLFPSLFNRKEGGPSMVEAE